MITPEDSPWTEADMDATPAETEVSLSPGGGTTRSKSVSSSQRPVSYHGEGASASVKAIPRAASVPAKKEAGAVFVIEVDDPQQQGAGLSSFTSYRVTSRARSKTFVVRRRFRDFTWLQEELALKFQGRLVPLLPAKQIKLFVEHGSPLFIAMRRRALEKFLRRVASHPVLMSSPDFLSFITSSDSAFNSRVEESTAERNSVFTRLSDNIGTLFRQTMEGPQADAMPTASIYLRNIETHLLSVTHTAFTLIQLRKDAGMQSAQMAAGLKSLAEGPLGHAMEMLGNTFMTEGDLQEEMVIKEGEMLGEALEDQIRLVRAAKDVLETQDIARGKLQLAQQRLGAKNARLGRLEQREEKDGAVEDARDLIKEAEQTVLAAESQASSIQEWLTGELNVFHKERHASTRMLLNEVVQARIQHHQKLLDLWKDMITEVSELTEDPGPSPIGRG